MAPRPSAQVSWRRTRSPSSGFTGHPVRAPRGRRSRAAKGSALCVVSVKLTPDVRSLSCSFKNRMSKRRNIQREAGRPHTARTPRRPGQARVPDRTWHCLEAAPASSCGHTWLQRMLGREVRPRARRVRGRISGLSSRGHREHRFPSQRPQKTTG